MDFFDNNNMKEEFERKRRYNKLEKLAYQAKHNGFYFEPYNDGNELMAMEYNEIFDAGRSSLSEVDAPAGEFPFNIFNTEKLCMLTIPSEADDLPVTAIGEHAFSELSYDVINIPKSVKYIFNGAFEKSNIKFIYMPGVEIIGENAFQDCRELKMVEFPKSLKGLHDKAFNGCRDFRILYNGQIRRYTDNSH